MVVVITAPEWWTWAVWAANSAECPCWSWKPRSYIRPLIPQTIIEQLFHSQYSSFLMISCKVAVTVRHGQGSIRQWSGSSPRLTPASWQRCALVCETRLYISDHRCRYSVQFSALAINHMNLQWSFQMIWCPEHINYKNLVISLLAHKMERAARHCCICDIINKFL